MSDESSPLPWSAQQWARLRAAAQEAANKARVASSFLPKSGPLPPGQTTVPSHWMSEKEIQNPRTGEAEQRLEVNAGRTLELTTISSNVYLRGTEIEDPSLSAAEAKVRRAAEILGRVEDAIVFNGLGGANEPPKRDGAAVVQPTIYKVSGGHGLTGLLEAPGTLWSKAMRESRRAFIIASQEYANASLDQDKTAQDAARRRLKKARDDISNREAGITASINALRTAQEALETATPNDSLVKDRDARARDLDESLTDIMCVAYNSGDQDNAPIVSAVVRAIEKLEKRGQFGPFVAVFGDMLFSDAHRPNNKSLVLPSDRILPFLGHGDSLLRSSTIPPDEGVIIALAGDPIELVVGTDLEVKYLQTTEEPRYVLRVFERFVLRIKQLDAICAISSGDCLNILKRGRKFMELG